MYICAVLHPQIHMHCTTTLFPASVHMCYCGVVVELILPFISGLPQVAVFLYNNQFQYWFVMQGNQDSSSC